MADVVGCMIDWSKYKVGGLITCKQSFINCNAEWDYVIHKVFQSHWQSSCTALTAGKHLPLRLCKGTVKVSSESRDTPGEGIIQGAHFFSIISLLLKRRSTTSYGHQFYVDTEPTLKRCPTDVGLLSCSSPFQNFYTITMITIIWGCRTRFKQHK